MFLDSLCVVVIITGCLLVSRRRDRRIPGPFFSPERSVTYTGGPTPPYDSEMSLSRSLGRNVKAY